MKYTLLLFLVLFANILLSQIATDSISIRKQIARNQKDSLKKLPYKINKALSFFKLGFSSGGLNFANLSSSLIFQSGPGMGGEITVGFKVHKHLALGFGGNMITYHLNRKLLDQSVGNYFSNFDYTTFDTSTRAGRMNRAEGYLYVSYWYYHPKFIVELYSKLGFGYTSLKLSNVVYRRKTFSNNSEYFLLTKPNEFVGFLPSAGVCGSIPFNRIAYFFLGGEYGYSFHRFQTMMINHHTSDGRQDIFKLDIPKVTHIFQVNIGVLLRMNNRVKAHERKYDPEILKRINSKNN
jgi:hypothetical protein